MAKRTRQSYTDAQKKAYVQNHPESGLTVDAYCKEHNLTPSTFRNWRERIQSGEQLTQPSGGAAKGTGRTTEDWAKITSYAKMHSTKAAAQKFKVTTSAIYARQQHDRGRNRKPVGAKGAHKTVAKRTNGKGSGLARRKPEQTNLIPVVEHEPVSIPSFEDVKLEEGVFTVNKEDLWLRINSKLQPIDPTERIHVFALIHQLLEA